MATNFVTPKRLWDFSVGQSEASSVLETPHTVQELNSVIQSQLIALLHQLWQKFRAISLFVCTKFVSSDDVTLNMSGLRNRFLKLVGRSVKAFSDDSDVANNENHHTHVQMFHQDRTVTWLTLHEAECSLKADSSSCDQETQRQFVTWMLRME